MEIAVTSKLFNNKALHKLNIIQMHLEVIFISDLVLFSRISVSRGNQREVRGKSTA